MYSLTHYSVFVVKGSLYILLQFEKINNPFFDDSLKKALSLVKQIELFFKHLEKNCTDANQTTSIGASFQSINSKMDQLKNYLASSSKNTVLVDRLSQMGYHENKIKKAECLLKQLKLTFMNDRDFQELKQLNNCLNEENDFVLWRF